VGAFLSAQNKNGAVSRSRPLSMLAADDWDMNMSNGDVLTSARQQPADQDRPPNNALRWSPVTRVQWSTFS